MIRPLVAYDDAVTMILGSSRRIGSEAVELRTAHGRRLSEAIFSRRDYPFRDVSAMDGYAIAHADLAGPYPIRLRCLPPIYAGDPAVAIGTGWTREVATGAVIPHGAGAVLFREHAHLTNGVLVLEERMSSGANIRRRGEDMRAGARVLSAGVRINAANIGALSAYGIDEVTVNRRPHVALIPTGSELTNPADGSAAIDSNGPMIKAALIEAGATADLSKPIEDDAKSLSDAIEASLASAIDMVVTTGGVSAGTRDLLPRALQSIGARIHFHGVAIRPGKPLLFASARDGRPIFALPGNPIAAYATFRFFVVAALRTMAGLPVEIGEHVAVNEVGRPGWTSMVVACSRRGQLGELNVSIVTPQQSHRLGMFLDADSWVLIPDGNGPRLLFPMVPALT